MTTTQQPEALRQYAVRDHMGLGDYYLRHVSAMTKEGLHAKSDIAAELAYRDREIDRKHAEIETLRKDVDHKDAYAEQLGRDLSKAHAETIALQAGYNAARLEIESLHAQLESIGAGGVEPLRKSAQAAPDVSGYIAEWRGGICTAEEAMQGIAKLYAYKAAPPTLTEQQAYDMGAKGAPATDAERLLFEAWMRGHVWALCATWDGKCYRGAAEHDGGFDPNAMATRRLWAAWRDRAALAAKGVPAAPWVRRIERTTFPSSPAHKALSAFCGAMYDRGIEGADMRAAMLWFLGLEECQHAAAGVTAGAVAAWRIKDEGYTSGWNDGAPTNAQLQEVKSSLPKAVVEYALLAAAPQPPAEAQEPTYETINAMEKAWHDVCQDSSITSEAKWRRFYRAAFATHPAPQQAEPAGEIVVTKNEQGQIVAVTRQDKEGRVLSVIAESSAPAEGDAPELLAYAMQIVHERELRVTGNPHDEDGAVRRFTAAIGRYAAPAEGDALTQAARDVLAERQRQISAEGWTPEHDDKHDSGEMAGAAGCYARHVNARSWVVGMENDDYADEPVPDVWPWDEVWWKPTTPRRDLVKAGALILAELERIDRAAMAAQKGGA